MEYIKSGNTIVVRIDYDEEVIEKLTELCKKENITSASISGIGATKLAELGLYNMETREYKVTSYTGLYEVGSFMGNIT